MRVGILLGSPDISGGTYVIFEHAIRLKKKGVDITIITEEKISMDRLNWHKEAKKLTWKTYNEVSNIKFDIVIATWWRTVYELSKIEAKKYVYFVQSIESRFYAEEEKPLKKLVESTYIMPLYIITEAKWIKEYLKVNYNKECYLVPNGIRKDLYNTTGEKFEERNDRKLRVLIEGPVDVEFKNVPKTIQLCKKSLADEVWLLTSTPINNIEGVDKVYSRLPIFETSKVYRSCDVIVKLSYVEGMFGPPLEMFHCGGTSITYDVTGYDEYIVNEYNGLVARCDNDNKIIEFINMLKNDKNKLKSLKINAIKTATEWPDWNKSSEIFNQCIIEINNNGNIEQKDLKIQIKFLFEFYAIAENYKNTKTKVRFHKVKLLIYNKFPKLFNLLKKIKINIMRINNK